MEALVVVALVAMAAGMVSLEVAGVRPAAERVTRLQQQRGLQEALDRWLAAAPSLADARLAFEGGDDEGYPESQRGFLIQELGPHLAPETLALWTGSSTVEVLRTAQWQAIGGGLVVAWTGNWRESSPRVRQAEVDE